jgi:Flp pilus assembly protein TadG
MAMVRLSSLRAALGRFRRQEDGVALVEFALTFPLMLLIFAVIVEGSRTFWSYHSTISGVRDATRYVGRVAPLGICASGGSLAYLNTTVLDMVRQGTMPGAVTVTGVQVGYTCESSPSVAYRTGEVPVATVRADLTIEFPLAGLFRLVGGDRGTVNTSVTDQTRIHGI